MVERFKAGLSWANLRRIYATFFFGLFALLLALTQYRLLKGYPVDWFLKLDPLLAFAGLLTSGVFFAGLAWGLGLLVLTLIFGRFFCSWICPLGIANQFSGWFFNKIHRREAEQGNEYNPWQRLKYYILAFLVGGSVFGALQIGLLDPLPLITRSFNFLFYPPFEGSRDLPQRLYQGAVLVGLMFGSIIWANRVWRRFFCRLLCPLGAFLGVLSTRSLVSIRRDVDSCTACGQCEAVCEGACEPSGELRTSECVLCMNCIEACPEGALSYSTPGPKSSVHQPLEANRRRWIEAFGAGLLLYPALRFGFKNPQVAQAKVIRPPGSLPEEDFLKRCIKCGQCMKVCPTNVLQPALLEAGLEGLWTPVLINKLGYCEQNCVLCSQVCPTDAILPIKPQQRLGNDQEPPLKLGTAFYDRGRCLPWAMQTQCIVCEEVCPTSPKAIWYETVEVTARDGSKKKLKRPFVEPERCIGCGACENQCPVVDHAAIRVSSVGESRSKKNRMIL